MGRTTTTTYAFQVAAAVGLCVGCRGGTATERSPDAGVATLSEDGGRETPSSDAGAQLARTDGGSQDGGSDASSGDAGTPTSMVDAGSGSGARRIVFHDFEDGAWGPIGHGATGGDLDGSSVTTDNAHSGTYAAQVDYSGGNNLNHLWYDGLRGAIDRELYVSFWFYYHPNWQFHSNHKVMRLTNSFSYFYTNHEFMADTGAFFTTGAWHWQPASECGNPENGWSTHVITRGEWHHWEFYGQLNTNGNDDGTIRVWIDGVPVKDDDRFTWLAPGCDPQSERYKWNTIYFPSNYADSPPGGSTPIYYVDDIEIWDGMP